MRWKRDKTVRVELLTPISLHYPISSSDLSSPPSNAVKKTVGKLDTDLVFKGLAYLAIVIQAALAVYGYSKLMGYFEQFGIVTSELDLGIPTLLTYGYISAFTGTMSTVKSVPILGAFTPGLIFMSGAALIVIPVMRKAKIATIIWTCCWVGFISLMVFVAPALGLSQGADEARSGYFDITGVKAGRGFNRAHNIITDKAESLTGHLLIADTKNTYLLINDMVYKIDNASNRVVRRVLLQPKPEEASKKVP